MPSKGEAAYEDAPRCCCGKLLDLWFLGTDWFECRDCGDTNCNDHGSEEWPGFCYACALKISYRLAARKLHEEPKVLEIPTYAKVEVGAGGAWVSARVWVVAALARAFKGE